MKKDFYGYDSLTNEEIEICGSLKGKINTYKIQIKRGNEELIKEEIKTQIETITGKEPFVYEGTNHIVFAENVEKANGEEYFLIKWHK